jgi:hypothetical protein
MVASSPDELPLVTRRPWIPSASSDGPNSAALDEIEAVRRAGLDPHDDVVALRCGVGHGHVPEDLASARLVVAHRLHLSPRTNGRASAAGWRTRLANTAIATIVTTAGAMARKAGSIAS